MTADRLASDLATLCRSCGLCCDGSLFGRVGLEPGEVEPARRTLRVVGRTFEQPCAALVPADARGDGGRACGIYPDRPASCRRFVCRLYERHRRDGGPLEPRLEAVRRARELLAALDVGGSHPELVQRIEEDFARA